MKEKTNLYRIWYSDGNDRSELGRVTANDIDHAIEYAKKEYLKPDTQFYSEDGDADFSVYLMIDTCKDCDLKDCLKCTPSEGEDLTRDACQTCKDEETTPCEDCERSEYLEIQLDNDSEPEYKTIMGTNEYANLNTATRPTAYNETLAQAWKDSPQKGLAALILQTAQHTPAFSKDLLDKSRDTLDQ